ncbi:MAG: alanyl-tRNA editing protein [Acidobacteriota bacterium]
MTSNAATGKIYYTDSYCRRFEATVREVRAIAEGFLVDLDQTCFYPTSGGQPHDLGRLQEATVLDVLEEEDRVLHRISDDVLHQGQVVTGTIDWSRRFDHMQQHTGQHILSQAFVRALGAETVSFHLGAEVCTIDLAREELTTEEIYQSEDVANAVVFEGRAVNVHFADESDTPTLELRKPSKRTGQLRIVEIADFDRSACGGTHCRQTGEVGLIKIRRWERVKKQARIEFVCGYRALGDYRWKNRAVYQLSRFLSYAEREVVAGVEHQQARLEQLRKDLEQSQRFLLVARAEELARQAEHNGTMLIVRAILQENEAHKAADLARQIVAGGPSRLVLIGARGPQPSLVFARSADLTYDMRQWMAGVTSCIEGRGGGRPDYAQAGGKRQEGLEEALARAMEML